MIDSSGILYYFCVDKKLTEMMADQNHVLNLRCEPVPVVRIAFIGMGNRGLATLKRYLILQGVEIKAVCDLNPDNIRKAKEILQGTAHAECRMYAGKDDWQDICRDDSIDLVYICTDWNTHATMAIEAMRQGKHVAVEVPLAMTVKDCWSIVDTAEQTQRHCFMLENCCYDPFALMTLNMAQKGVLGEITHCEGAYIHDLRERYHADTSHGGYFNGWMTKYCQGFQGNPYPTHGLGPIAQLLNIHRGDRLKYLVSMPGRAEAGNPMINSTLIRTEKDVSIMLQYDVSTPRPYSRMQTTCGTLGFTQKYPQPVVRVDSVPEDRDADYFMQKYRHPLSATLGEEGKALGVTNEMNYIMDRRLIYCLQNGLPLDMDVYDAAEWSCITQLSALSAAQGSRPMEIPDFTRGRWQQIQGFHFFL